MDYRDYHIASTCIVLTTLGVEQMMSTKLHHMVIIVSDSIA